MVNGNILITLRYFILKSLTTRRKRCIATSVKARFVDVTRTQPKDFRLKHVGRGLAVGDYDNDGWQDFLVSNNGEDAQLFRNEGGSSPGGAGQPLAGGEVDWSDFESATVLVRRCASQLGDFRSYDQVKGG